MASRSSVLLGERRCSARRAAASDLESFLLSRYWCWLFLLLYLACDVRLFYRNYRADSIPGNSGWWAAQTTMVVAAYVALAVPCMRCNGWRGVGLFLLLRGLQHLVVNPELSRRLGLQREVAREEAERPPDETVDAWLGGF